MNSLVYRKYPNPNASFQKIGKTIVYYSIWTKKTPAGTGIINRIIFIKLYHCSYSGTGITLIMNLCMFMIGYDKEQSDRGQASSEMLVCGFITVDLKNVLSWSLLPHNHRSARTSWFTYCTVHGSFSLSIRTNFSKETGKGSHLRLLEYSLCL
jgi:hypothetical protein